MTLDKEVEEFRAELIKSIEFGEKLTADGFEKVGGDTKFTLECIEALNAVTSFADLETLKTRYDEVMVGLIEAECLREVGGLQ
jgi:hypothetical protein